MDKAQSSDSCAAVVTRGGLAGDSAQAQGKYYIECHGPDGQLKWADTIDNILTTVGVTLMLDTLLAGSAYTTVGPFMGLKGTGTATVAHTMASHAAWSEVGGANAPTYTSPRKTITFSASSGTTTITKATTGTYTFAITSSGTVAGCFVVTGTGAVSTIDNTSGTLLSAGDFTGGSKTVSNGDSLTVTWSVAITPA